MSGFLAVDIGGTHMRAAHYPSDSIKPIKIKKISTQHPSETAWERLVRLVTSIWPEDGDIAVIGVAAPGPLDPFQGVLFSAPNIPGWVNLPLPKMMEECFSRPVVMGNDANLAALGEWKYGAGKGHHNLVYLTVSTGIGGGVIVNDQMLLGTRGLAAELGHITVVPDGPMCGCGQKGHLEALASGPAIARWVVEEIHHGESSLLSNTDPVTTKQVADAAATGDKLAIRALNRAGHFIGVALADILHIFNPTIIIVGGGVSRSGEYLFTPMRAAMREHVMDSHYLENLTLTQAALGDDTGLLGALALARHQT